jgi:hypothetical protein
MLGSLIWIEVRANVFSNVGGTAAGTFLANIEPR